MIRPKMVIFLAGALTVALVLSACGGAPSKSAVAPSPRSPSGTSQTPSGTSVIVPVARNPISNGSTVSGLSILKAEVENNLDPLTNKPIADRLMIHVENGNATVATGFEIFYTMTDMVTKASESYYFKLTDFSIQPGSSGYLYFDNKPGIGHFPENKFSIYRSSKNEVDFIIELSAQGLKPVTSTAIKSKGTGEKVD